MNNILEKWANVQRHTALAKTCWWWIEYYHHKGDYTKNQIQKVASDDTLDQFITEHYHTPQGTVADLDRLFRNCSNGICNITFKGKLLIGRDWNFDAFKDATVDKDALELHWRISVSQ